jgi:oligopeptide/dipeptide ABC transporter ATP-binding protein
MALLAARDLRLFYATPRGPVHAVDGVSVSVDPGEAVAVVGESGSGKTTLACALMRLLPPNVHTYGGEINVNGMDLMTLSEEQFRERIRWKEMAMVFQGAMNSLNPVLRVGFQVAEPLVARKGLPGDHALKEAIRLLRQVGLPADIAQRYPHELSGGMKQRVVIATALTLHPRILILDEPTSALDVSVQAQIMNLLKGLKRDEGLALLFITHDIAVASDLCDRFAVLYAGEIVEEGTAEQVLLDAKHPYTSLLVASTPRLKTDQSPQFIPGAPPDLAQPPTGCRFRARCPLAFERCTQWPPPFAIGDGHMTRCWLHQSNP